MSTTITVSKFYTRNLGNFENAKVGFELSSDDIREGESVEDFKSRLNAKVDAWMQEEINDIDREARRARKA